MNSLKNINRLTVSNDLVIDLTKLYQFKGKDFYYEDAMKSDMDYIIKQTIERESFYFGKYLQISISENRTRLIIKKNANPKNKDEQLLYNIKSMFTLIQDEVNNFELNANEVLKMANYMYKDVKDISFNTETINVQVNLLQEKKKVSTRKNLEELMALYEKMLNSRQYELTQLICNFYIDFINMNIFSSDNDKIGILLLYILLFRERFNLYRYVSFFELLLQKLESFNKAVLMANFNWSDGYSQTTSLNRILIELMLVGYNKIENMVRDYTYDLHLNKSDNIENTISKLGEIFTKDQIREKHPLISESTINRTLQRLRDENKIRPNGVGRSATWIRLVNTDRFDPNMKQMSLFEFVLDEEKES